MTLLFLSVAEALKILPFSFLWIFLVCLDIIKNRTIEDESLSYNRGGFLCKRGKQRMSFLGSMELDPQYMALYVVAAVLSTIGLFILFRESRARKKALEEEKAAFEAEKEREKQEREKRQKRAAKKKKH